MAWVGSALVAIGVALDIVATRRFEASFDVIDDSSMANQASVLLIAGFAATFAGLAFVSTALLRGLARVLAPVSVSARLAARDAARNVGRTVPVIAAIGATLAIATAVVVTNDQDIARWQGERDFQAPLGDGRLYLDMDATSTTAGELVEAVRSVVPDATITEVAAWDTGTVEPGTLVPEVAYPRELLCLHQGRTAREIAEDPRCDDDVAWNSNVAVGGAAQLSAITGQEPSQAALDALAGGEAVAFNPDQVTDGALTIQLWDYAAGNYPSYGDEAGPTNKPSGEFGLPAVVERTAGGQTRAFAGIISPATAAELGYPVVPSTVYVHVDGGIDQKQEARINAALTTAGGGWLRVERLYETPQYQLLLAYAALAVALLVAGAATGVALGLARADARRDDFTLASLGASPRLARASAGWQGAIIVAVASAMGLATGLMTTWTLSYQSLDMQFSPPWLWLGAALIALPSVVGLLAAAFTKPVRATHYRLAA
ncbi:hypothetical protein LGT39_02575 [Demequina sp. TTPB684]|nr:hypothetical protein [Demequina sp. TTPB684]